MLRCTSLPAVALALIVIVLAAPAIAHDPPSPADAATIGLAATGLPVAAGIAILAFQDSGLQGPGVVLLGLGTVFGPSVASAMLNDPRRAGIGIGIRTASSAMFLASAAWRFSAGWGEHGTGITLSNAAIVVSLAGLVYGVAYNFATLNRSANELHAAAGIAIDQHSGAPIPSLVIRF